MNNIKDSETIVHSTSEGRLYIKASELFSQPKVQKMVAEMMASDIFKNILRNKRKSH